MTEFDDVIRLLEDSRPQASPRELDAIKQRVRRRAAEPSRRSQSMKSRLAILGMLITGLFLSTAGVGLAISGGTGSNASVAQYGTVTPQCTPTSGTTSPAEVGGTTQPSQSSPCEEGGVLPAEAVSTPTKHSAKPPKPKPTTEGGVLPAEEAQTQPERQEAAAAATTTQLPFTGFAAIPVLLGGLVLLTGGLILRRRTRSDS
jgi:hypothetical protein